MAFEPPPLTTIFSKRPLPGQVKTRLCPPFTPGQAAALALAMLDDTVERHLAAPGYATELAVAPKDSTGWFLERYGHRVPVVAQVGDGLGERLANWFGARCQGAANRSVVIVGSDCPMLGTQAVAAAHAALADGSDVVFAPDGGGGYSLVGMLRPRPELFTQIRMSTGSMLDETLDLARSGGLSIHLLAEHPDVDTPDDVVRLDRQLQMLTQMLTMEGRGSTPPEFPARTFDCLQGDGFRGTLRQDHE